MPKMNRIWIAAALIVAIPSLSHANSALLFLSPDLGAGARPAALGGSVVGSVNDATATYWNPAGLARVEGWDLSGTHTEWLQDIRYEHVALARNHGRHGFGFSFATVYAGDFDGRDEVGNKELSFGFSDVAVGGSYGLSLSEAISVGTTVKYVRESIDDVAADGFAFDFGAQYATGVDGLSLGAAIRNLGSRVKFDLENAVSSDMPRVIQAGGSYLTNVSPLSGTIRLSADVLDEKNQETSLRFGTEYQYNNQFGLLFGYRASLSDAGEPAAGSEKLDDTQNVSFGASFDRVIRVEYAFVPFSQDLGSTHRFSVGKHW